MEYKTLFRFLRTTVVLWLLVIVISAVVSPPDPFTQILYAIPLLFLATVISYILTYRGGFDYLETKF